MWCSATNCWQTYPKHICLIFPPSLFWVGFIFPFASFSIFIVLGLYVTDVLSLLFQCQSLKTFKAIGGQGGELHLLFAVYGCVHLFLNLLIYACGLWRKYFYYYILSISLSKLYGENLKNIVLQFIYEV